MDNKLNHNNVNNIKQWTLGMTKFTGGIQKFYLQQFRSIKNQKKYIQILYFIIIYYA